MATATTPGRVGASMAEKAPPILYPDQAQLMRDAYAKLKGMTAPKRRLLVAAATGFGKTVTGSAFACDATRKGWRVFFIVDRDRLVEQSLATFAGHLNCPIGVVKSGYPEDRLAPMQIASRQTMESRGWWREWIRQGPCLIMPDECHETSFAAVVRNEQEYPRENQIWVGLTATPWRLSTREGLGDLFDDIVQSPPPRALMEQGRLLWPRYVVVPDRQDDDKVGTVGGDYNLGQLSKVYNTPRAIASLWNNWSRWVKNERNVIFAVNKDHAKAIAAHWAERGAKASIITEETDGEDRHRAYAGLKSGHVPTLVNVNVATKGFDEPKLRWVVLARKTKSVTLLHQMIGRGARPDRPCFNCGREVPLSAAPTCRGCGQPQPPAHVATWPTWFGVLDQTGTLNDPDICLPDMFDRYELHRGTGGAPGRAPTKTCQQCGHIVHVSAPVCPTDRGGCGAPFPVRRQMEQTGRAQELAAVDKARKDYSYKARGKWALKHDPDATDREWENGRTPRARLTPEIRLHAIFPRPTEADRRAFREHLVRCAAKKAARRAREGIAFDEGAWVEKWMRWEFGDVEQVRAAG